MRDDVAWQAESEKSTVKIEEGTTRENECSYILWRSSLSVPACQSITQTSTVGRRHFQTDRFSLITGLLKMAERPETAAKRRPAVCFSPCMPWSRPFVSLTVGTMCSSSVHAGSCCVLHPVCHYGSPLSLMTTHLVICDDWLITDLTTTMLNSDIHQLNTIIQYFVSGKVIVLF